MKFTFNIIETSVLTHTVEAENLMEAENKINSVYCNGSLDIPKYGIHSSDFELIEISE